MFCNRIWLQIPLYRFTVCTVCTVSVLSPVDWPVTCLAGSLLVWRGEEWWLWRFVEVNRCDHLSGATQPELQRRWWGVDQGAVCGGGFWEGVNAVSELWKISCSGEINSLNGWCPREQVQEQLHRGVVEGDELDELKISSLAQFFTFKKHLLAYKNI